MTSPLTPDGEQLRQQIGAAGVELTPDQLAEGLEEAEQRIRAGPDGCCVICGASEDRDFRYGVCDKCAFCQEPDCLKCPTKWGGYCEAHGSIR